MNADEAQALKAALARWNIPGVVAPEELANPDGEWQVYDSGNPETRTDITAAVLAALAKFEGPEPAAHRKASSGPTRGFVIRSGS
jgi:hypothetical protein